MRPAAYKDADGRARENFASRFRKAFNVAFDAMSKRYVRGVIWFCRRRMVTWGLLVVSVAVSVAVSVVLMRTTRKTYWT